MRLASTLDLYGGGPGSGCRGENCGRPTSASKTADAITRKLESVSKSGPVPKFVQTGIRKLTEAGVDPRFFQQRTLTSFRTADALSIHPLVIGNYNESRRALEFRSDADSDVVTHELAHHIDIAFVRAGGSGINAAVAKQVVENYTKEYQTARAGLSAALGHKFNFTNDHQALEKNPRLIVGKGAPTPYALDSSKEWFAESAMLYCKGGAARDRLERMAPQTYKAIQTVFSGKVFK